jgi:hypothetical protein
MRRHTPRPHRHPRRRALASSLLRRPGTEGALARFATLASFYGEDPRRASSGEVDVGLWWREGAEEPLHRAAWVEATGELYAVRLGPAREGQPAVELLAVFDDEGDVAAALEGWRERCGEPRSLAWLRRRTATATALERPRGAARRAADRSDAATAAAAAA